MSQLESTHLDEIVAKSQTNTEAVAAAISRALGVPLEFSIGWTGSYAQRGETAEMADSGHLLILCVGNRAAVLVLPESTSRMASGSTQSNGPEMGRLETLGDELAGLVLPDGCAMHDCCSLYALDLNGALERGCLAENAAQINFALRMSDGQTTNANLVWPLEKPQALVDEIDPAERAAARAAAAATPRPTRVAPAPIAEPAEEAYDEPIPARSETDVLPSYMRSLLKISVPVVVTLASTKRSVQQIIELVPGAIIQFDKPCDQMLDLCVGGHRVGEGEAVKVGDKFGIRLTSLLLPDERFRTVGSH